MENFISSVFWFSLFTTGIKHFFTCLWPFAFSQWYSFSCPLRIFLLVCFSLAYYLAKTLFILILSNFSFLLFIAQLLRFFLCLLYHFSHFLIHSSTHSNLDTVQKLHCVTNGFHAANSNGHFSTLNLLDTDCSSPWHQLSSLKSWNTYFGFQVLYPSELCQSQSSHPSFYVLSLVNLSHFIFFWPRWVFVAACRLSLMAASGDYSSLRYTGFSLQWLLLLWSRGSRRADFSSCSTWAQ